MKETLSTSFCFFLVVSACSKKQTRVGSKSTESIPLLHRKKHNVKERLHSLAPAREQLTAVSKRPQILIWSVIQGVCVCVCARKMSMYVCYINTYVCVLYECVLYEYACVPSECVLCEYVCVSYEYVCVCLYNFMRMHVQSTEVVSPNLSPSYSPQCLVTGSETHLVQRWSLYVLTTDIYSCVGNTQQLWNPFSCF